jgi:hypothetical protein
LLLDRTEVLLMQGIGTVCPIGTYTDNEGTAADVGQCAEIVSKIIDTVELPLKVQALALASAFVH